MLARTYYLSDSTVNAIDKMSSETGYSKNEIVDMAILALTQDPPEKKEIKPRTIDKLRDLLEMQNMTLEGFAFSINVEMRQIYTYCRSKDMNRKIWPIGTSRTQKARNKQREDKPYTITQYIDVCIIDQFGQLPD